MKTQKADKIKLILTAAITAVALVSFIFSDNARYFFAKYFTMTDHITHDGEHYYFHGSEGDVDEGMYLLGDKIEIILVDKNGNPYKKDESEWAYLYLNDPEKKYIYYEGGSWKKVDFSK